MSTICRKKNSATNIATALLFPLMVVRQILSVDRLRLGLKTFKSQKQKNDKNHVLKIINFLF